MKSLFVLFLWAVSASPGLAADVCYDFDVVKQSEGLKVLKVKLAEKSAVVSTIHESKGFEEATFACVKTRLHSTCTQPDGAGDFTLTVKGKSATLTTAYLNLALAKVVDGESEIGEEFAIYDRSVDNGASETSEDESDELEEIQIAGQEVSCGIAK